MADNVDPEPPPPPPEEVTVTQPVTAIPPAAPPPHQGCMEKRSTLEKILLVLIIIILIICLGMIAAFLIFYFFATPPQGTCLTEECVKAASRLKSYMDERVDPCTNFYEYACGGWLKTQVLEPHERGIGVQSTIGDANNKRIRDLLEKPRDPSGPEYETQAKIFYTACMNTAKLDERGKVPFLKVLETIGKFPSLDDSWNETDFNLDSILIKLTRLAVMPLLTVDVGRDLQSASVNRIYISDATLALGGAHKYKNGRNDTRVRSYEKWLVENLVLLGADRAEAEQESKEIVDFEIRIAKLMRSDIEKANITAKYNSMTIAVLQSKYPWLKWLEYFQGIGSDPFGDRPYITMDETIINFEPLYFEKLGVVLANTTKRVLANYLLSRLITFTSYLGSDYVTLSDQFMRETQGVEPRPRWERCVAETTNVFPQSVSKMYVDSYFHEDAKKYMKVMIDDLTTAFSEILNEIQWMTKETKEKAHEKLKAMESKVGYPDDLDVNRLNTMYKGIPVNEDEYLESIIASRNNSVKERVRELREPRDKKRWPVHAATVNAQYDMLANEIIFPAAFLQPPVYGQEYTSSMNYGAIGMIIGHEITHGFDTAGHQYNAQGILKDWWTAEDSKSFLSRAQCFVDQYGCYKWDGHSLDGQRTLGENIADNGGLKQSFRAYRNYIDRSGTEELRLPGLRLNHNQIFFLSFAQVWCSKFRDEHKKDLIEIDPHTPSPYRVYGTLQNSRDFAEAFHCPVGSRMNPVQKCELW